MRCYFTLYFFLLSAAVTAQNLELHYDIRHSLDPRHNDKNFITLSFETFRWAEYGSFLLKAEFDFNGKNNNIGNLYTQISQTLKFWDFPVFLHLEYAGGLGYGGEAYTGYYINNAFLLGAAYSFQWKNSWVSTYLAYKYNNFDKPSHDVQYSFWWGKNIFNNKLSISSNFVIWTENKNRGDELTANLKDKEILFYVEQKVWYNLNQQFSVGSKIKLFCNIFSYSNFLVYPTVAIKYNF